MLPWLRDIFQLIEEQEFKSLLLDYGTRNSLYEPEYSKNECSALRRPQPRTMPYLSVTMTSLVRLELEWIDGAIAWIGRLWRLGCCAAANFTEASFFLKKSPNWPSKGQQQDVKHHILALGHIWTETIAKASKWNSYYAIESWVSFKTLIWGVWPQEVANAEYHGRCRFPSIKENHTFVLFTPAIRHHFQKSPHISTTQVTLIPSAFICLPANILLI